MPRFASSVQRCNGVHAEKLIKFFEDLGKRYKLRDQMFPHGFSAGSQFVHRFAMNHPKLVCGVSAHSGGTWATEEVQISAEWKHIEGLAKKSSPDKPAPSAPAAIPEETIRAAFAKADAEEIPTDKLLAFMRKYPPILWKDKPGSAKLLEQCRNAAETWLAAAKANGRWNGKDKEDFLRHSEGLGIETDG